MVARVHPLPVLQKSIFLLGVFGFRVWREPSNSQKIWPNAASRSWGFISQLWFRRFPVDSQWKKTMFPLNCPVFGASCKLKQNTFSKRHHLNPSPIFPFQLKRPYQILQEDQYYFCFPAKNTLHFSKNISTFPIKVTHCFLFGGAPEVTNGYPWL